MPAGGQTCPECLQRGVRLSRAGRVGDRQLPESDRARPWKGPWNPKSCTPEHKRMSLSFSSRDKVPRDQGRNSGLSIGSTPTFSLEKVFAFLFSHMCCQKDRCLEISRGLDMPGESQAGRSGPQGGGGSWHVPWVSKPQARVHTALPLMPALVRCFFGMGQHHGFSCPCDTGVLCKH